MTSTEPDNHQHSEGDVVKCGHCQGVGHHPVQFHTDYGYQTLDDSCLDCDGLGYQTIVDPTTTPKGD